MRRGHLLDASALLAVLFREPGSDHVLQLIDDCEIHAVNLAETLRKLMHAGVPEIDIERTLRELDLQVQEQFTARQALAVALLGYNARTFGLSLGDCVC